MAAKRASCVQGGAGSCINIVIIFMASVACGCLMLPSSAAPHAPAPAPDHEVADHPYNGVKYNCYQNFQHTCTILSLEPKFDKGGHIDMTASCGNGEGGQFVSAINLDRRLVNIDGTLDCRICLTFVPWGNAKPCSFSHSCKDVSIDPGTGILSATCERRGNNTPDVRASIDLNKCIGNVRGVLEWTECIPDCC